MSIHILHYIRSGVIPITVPTDVRGSSFGSVQEIASKVITTMMWIVGVAAVIGLLVGAILYVVSAGDPGKTRTAKDAIIYSVIGIVIAMFAYAIVTFVIGRTS